MAERRHDWFRAADSSPFAHLAQNFATLRSLAQGHSLTIEVDDGLGARSPSVVASSCAGRPGSFSPELKSQSGNISFREPSGNEPTELRAGSDVQLSVDLLGGKKLHIRSRRRSTTFTPGTFYSSREAASKFRATQEDRLAKSILNSGSAHSTAISRGLDQQATAGATQVTKAALAAKESQANTSIKTGGVFEQLCCGAFAGVISRTAVAPIDLVRVHLISSHGVHGAAHSTAVQVLTSILKRDGWRGLFRGNGVNCFRVAPHKAIEMCSYQMLKRSLSSFTYNGTRPLLSLASPLSGGAAGMAGTLFTYPLELVRTRISLQPHIYSGGLHSTIAQIVREEGFPALYRGLAPSLLGVFPYAATNYFVYDSLRSFYRKTTKCDNVPTIPTLAFGAFSAAISSSVTFPIEVARRQLQLGARSPLAPKTVVGIVRGIYEAEGFCAIYKGLGTTWLKLIPAAGISFVCYEAARVALRVDDASFARERKRNKELRRKAREEEITPA